MGTIKAHENESNTPVCGKCLYKQDTLIAVNLLFKLFAVY